MKLIEKAWHSYLERCVPPRAGPAQVMETRNAFYAGAMVLASALIDNLGEGSEPTARDEEVVKSVYEEISGYWRSMQ